MFTEVIGDGALRPRANGVWQPPAHGTISPRSIGFPAHQTSRTPAGTSSGSKRSRKNTGGEADVEFLTTANDVVHDGSGG